MDENWVESLCTDLRIRSDERGEAVDAAGAALLLELARDELGVTGPEGLAPDVLRELLLEVFPETVIAAADEVPAVLATVRAVVAHLGGTGGVPASRAAELAAEVDRIAPEFTKVVEEADRAERRLAAEVIGGMMADDGVPLGDEEAVARWVGEFEALPEEERFALTEEYLARMERRAVPPVRVAPEAEVAAAARRSPLTGRLRALVDWAGERALGEYDYPVDAETAEGARALGLDVSRRSGETRDDTAFERLWWAAVESKILSVGEGRAGPGPALEAFRSADDGAFLAVWLEAFDSLVVPDHDPDLGLDGMELVQNELTGVLIQLYEQEEPTPPDALAQALLDHVAEVYDVSDQATVARTVADAFALELETLEEWGIVEPAGDGGRALTPLGVWAVRELLRADGFAAPAVGELASASAAELVMGLTLHRPDTADEEIDGWLAGRDAKDAAADVLDVMRTAGPGARGLAAAVLNRIGPEAAPVVRAASEHTLVSPYAALWLRAAGDPSGRDLSRDEYLWVFVDTVAAMLETAEPAEAVAAAIADAPSGADMRGMVGELWRTDHDDVVGVLEALGGHHPDRATAKAARTAAYKARSASGRP
ncbi:hypothetical protein [Spirillospora albida]|uniref:hypothetical protein n=1 Tax=Spirillospora albida TaxID=58123 RepID=UPI0004BE9265|nr:hypothetical protein [Spirillospora albida]